MNRGGVIGKGMAASDDADRSPMEPGEPWRIVELFRRNRYDRAPEGEQRLPARTHVRAVCAGTTLDLRGWEIPAAGAEIHVYSVFAMVQILVPYGVNVRYEATGLFGAFGGNARYAMGFNGPTIRLRGFAMFGGVGGYVQS